MLETEKNPSKRIPVIADESRSLKYTGAAVVLQEVPDEISLAISISNCPNNCEGCHSPELRQDIGEPLTEESLKKEINAHDGITCVCFMGGDANLMEVSKLIEHVHELGYKTCVYSGLDDVRAFVVYYSVGCDYIKVGSYQKEFGGLNSVTTNQTMWRKSDDNQYVYDDITYKFWRLDDKI